MYLKLGELEVERCTLTSQSMLDVAKHVLELTHFSLAALHPHRRIGVL